MLPVKIDNLEDHDKRLFHVLGNTCEISLQNDKCLGGSWNDSLKSLHQKKIYTFDSPNAWTGFRNVCKWIELK